MMDRRWFHPVFVLFSSFNLCNNGRTLSNAMCASIRTELNAGKSDAFPQNHIRMILSVIVPIAVVRTCLPERTKHEQDSKTQSVKDCFQHRGRKCISTNYRRCTLDPSILLMTG